MSPADIDWMKSTCICIHCHSGKLTIKEGWVCCDGCGARLYPTEAAR